MTTTDSTLASLPTIEIAIPVYQGSGSLQRSIASVLDQDYPHFSLTIVDDGSHDNTIEIAHKYAQKDSRISVVSRPRGGASVQRNYILQHFGQDWLLWLDCGDLLAKDCLQRRVEFIRQRGFDKDHPIVIVGSIYNVTQDLKNKQLSQNQLDWISNTNNTLENLLSFAISGQVGLHYGGMLSREAISLLRSKKLKPYPEEMVNGPDYIAATRLAALGCQFIHHTDPLVTVVYEATTVEQGEACHKLIARFPDFCRGANHHKPYFGDDTRFMNNALACHFYRRAQVLEALPVNDPKKHEYTASAYQSAAAYNNHAGSLYEVLELAPSLAHKINLLKTFDDSPSDITWVTLRNVEIALHKKIRILRRLLTHGDYERQHLDLMITYIQNRKATYFFDLGASAGIYSAVLAHHCPHLQQIYAFEPTPIHYQLLQATVEKLRNRSISGKKIYIYPYAVGNQENEIQQLLVSNNFGGANRLLSSVSEEVIYKQNKLQLPDIHGSNIKVTFDDTIRVSSVSLDSRYPFTNETIAIKMDIEGHEFIALQGMETLLKKNHCFLQIETNPKSRQQLITQMRQLGYRLDTTINNDYFFNNLP